MRLPSQCYVQSLKTAECAESNMFNIIYFQIDFWITKQKYWMSRWDSGLKEKVACLIKLSKKGMAFLLVRLVESVALLQIVGRQVLTIGKWAHAMQWFGYSEFN